MTSVHVSVMTHDRSASLSALLSSLASQRSAEPFEITILDNGSSKRHAANVRRIAGEHGARLIQSDRNLFVAGKRVLEDEIFARTRPDVLVRVDDDVVLSEGWLDAVLSELTDETAVCGSIEDDDGDLAISGQRTFELADELVAGQMVKVWDYGWHEPNLAMPSEVVEFVGQRALAIDGRVAFQVRHDPVFLVGGDADYSLRLRDAGYELRVASAAMIRHRTLGEGDVVGFRVANNVVPSWQYFHQRWGFFARSAAAEAGMSLEDFAAAVVRSSR
jgi:GT2 family glycosyltransferase